MILATTPALHVHADPSPLFVVMALISISLGALIVTYWLLSRFFPRLGNWIDRRILLADESELEPFPEQLGGYR